MKLAIIGATGGSGRRLTEQAMRSGIEVVAVVRNLDRLDGLDPQRVEVADATRAEELSAALTGVDGVAFCVGPRPGEAGTVLEKSITATLQAMQRTGVQRLVAISATGAFTDGDDPPARFIAKPILRRLLAENFADTVAMERVIRSSDRDWTIVRAPRLLDREPRGRYRSRRDGNVRWHYSITRADLALAMLDSLTDSTAPGTVISVAN